MVKLSTGELFLKCVEIQIPLYWNNRHLDSYMVSDLLFLATLVSDNLIENYCSSEHCSVAKAAADFVYEFSYEGAEENWYQTWGLVEHYSSKEV